MSAEADCSLSWEVSALLSLHSTRYLHSSSDFRVELLPLPICHDVVTQKCYTESRSCCSQFQQQFEQFLKPFLLPELELKLEVDGGPHKSQSLAVFLPDYKEGDTCFGQQIMPKTIRKGPEELGKLFRFKNIANLSTARCYYVDHYSTDPSIHDMMSTSVTLEELIPLWIEAIEHYNNRKTKYTVFKKGLFIGFLSRDCFLKSKFGDKLFSEICRIVQELLDYLKRFERPQEVNEDIVEWDSLCKRNPIIGGVGALGANLSIKSGFAISFLRDELLWSSAVNLMTRRSIGVSLWISFKLTDLKLDISEIKSMLTETKIVRLLRNLNEKKVPFSYFYQYPGTMVETACGNGSAHIVISTGSYIEEITFKRVFSIQGARKWMEFWKFQTPISSNSELATQYGVSCHVLQLIEKIMEKTYTH